MVCSSPAETFSLASNFFYLLKDVREKSDFFFLADYMYIMFMNKVSVITTHVGYIIHLFPYKSLYSPTSIKRPPSLQCRRFWWGFWHGVFHLSSV